MSASPVRYLGLPCWLAVASLSAVHDLKAQTEPPPTILAPLASAIYDTSFLIHATEIQKQADALEAQHRTFEAMDLFEKLIATSTEQPPGLQHGYEFGVIVAASHLDAARTRIDYGEGLHDLKLEEENRRLIMEHLNAIPGLVVAASKAVDADADRNKFKANAYKMLAAGQFYVGVLNSSAKDLEGCIKAYQKLAQTDPGSAAESKRMVSFVKGVERQLNNSFFSYDNVVKLTAAVVKEAVPDVGGWLAVGVEVGADYYKKHQEVPVPPKTR